MRHELLPAARRRRRRDVVPVLARQAELLGDDDRAAWPAGGRRRPDRRPCPAARPSRPWCAGPRCGPGCWPQRGRPATRSTPRPSTGCWTSPPAERVATEVGGGLAGGRAPQGACARTCRYVARDERPHGWRRRRACGAGRRSEPRADRGLAERDPRRGWPSSARRSPPTTPGARRSSSGCSRARSCSWPTSPAPSPCPSSSTSWRCRPTAAPRKSSGVVRIVKDLDIDLSGRARAHRRGHHRQRPDARVPARATSRPATRPASRCAPCSCGRGCRRGPRPEVRGLRHPARLRHRLRPRRGRAVPQPAVRRAPTTRAPPVS